jgi:hypothetical protein
MRPLTEGCVPPVTESSDLLDDHDPLRGATLVDGQLSKVAEEDCESVRIPQRISDAAARAARSLRFDQSVGWPPQLVGASCQCLPARSLSGVGFNSDVQRASRALALQHPEVKVHLKGRCETLGVHLLLNHDKQCPGPLRTQVCFFNYTLNRLIEVTVEGDAITKVRLGESFQHSEAPIEMAQAIGLARAHPDIRGRVRGLEAHAILSVPMDASSPNYKHRCMLVMFTAENDVHRELPVKFSALVDLCDQTVIAHGECTCGDDAGSGGTPQSYKHQK